MIRGNRVTSIIFSILTVLVIVCTAVMLFQLNQVVFGVIELVAAIIVIILLLINLKKMDTKGI